MPINLVKSWLLNLLLIVLFTVFFLPKTNFLGMEDLGRHLKNGEIILSTGKVFTTNLYSYTEPDYFVINHHWLSGVVFYVVQKYLGFTGLTYFYALVSSITLFLAFLFAKKRIGTVSALFLVLTGLLYISLRSQIRPEVFSTFFVVLYIWLFDKFSRGEIKFNPLAALLLVSQILWVNFHLYFVFGLVITVIFAFSYLVNHDALKLKQTALLWGLLLLGCLVNPQGWRGFLVPFQILHGYGIGLIENNPVFYLPFFQPINTEINFLLWYLIFSVLAALGLILLSIKHRIFTKEIAWILLFGLFTFVGIKMLRNIAFFGYIYIFFYSVFLSYFSYLPRLVNKYFKYVIYVMLIGLVLKPHSSGLMADGAMESINFYKTNKIQGPILNNYDSGGYIIYGLFPTQKVFIDNRPEAYSKDFKENYALKVFTDESVWRDLDQKYHFNVIFLTTNSISESTQKFLLAKLATQEWKPVFFDQNSVIVVRNTSQNTEVINKYLVSDFESRLVVKKPFFDNNIPVIWKVLCRLLS